MLYIGLVGASGRMGQEIISVINLHNTKYQLAFAKVLTVEKLAPNECVSFPIGSTAQVIIDFSSPNSSMETVNWCVVNQVPLVIGTTGLSAVQQQQIQQAAQKIAILHSANMSLSVNILFKVVNLVARTWNTSEVEICETHHRYKLDAPSGTALKLGAEVALARNQDFSQVARFDRCLSQKSSRSPTEIGFAVRRGGDVVGEHTVSFFADGEELSLSSSITKRSSFAQGALYAAEFLINKSSGYYTMSDVLNLI